MEKNSSREPLLVPMKEPSNGIVLQSGYMSDHQSPQPKLESSSFAGQPNNNLIYNDKLDNIKSLVGSKNPINSSNLNRTKFAGLFWVSNARLLCCIMALDLMMTSVQVPSLPAVFESHGMDLRWQGWVSSVYGIISFFVGPMLSRVSDSLGRVHMLRLSALGSMVCALGSLHATSKWPFIIARIVPGLTKCSLPISQAYMVDVSQGNAERSKHLGMLGASFGVAFVLGPPLGGWAADLDPRYPFVIAVLEGGLLLAALHFMPEPSPLRKNGHKRLKSSASSTDVRLASASIIGETGDSVVSSSKGTPSSSSSFSPNGDTGSSIRRTKSSSLLSAEIGRSKAMLVVSGKSAPLSKGASPGGVRSDAGVDRKGRFSVFRGPGGRQLGWGFHDRFFFVVAETLYHSAFAPFLTEVLGFPAGTIGELLSFIGAVSAVTNAYLVGFLTERFGEKPLMTTSLLVLAVGWVMWSAVTVSTISILVALTMVGVGDNVFQTVNKAAVAQHAPPELVGTVMGMSGAMDTFGRTVASPLCGYIFKAWGARGVPVTCACAAAYVAVALSVRGFAAAAAAAAASAAAGTNSEACEDSGVGKVRANEVKRRWKQRDH